jgi:hypothetical protein
MRNETVEIVIVQQNSDIRVFRRECVESTLLCSSTTDVETLGEG